jgi:glutathione-regulated potassium-efflux system ancillary protein KefG
LLAHQIIIWHPSSYLSRALALFKQWIDVGLEYGWGHGKGGDSLRGKILFNVITTGGPREGYATSGYITVQRNSFIGINFSFSQRYYLDEKYISFPYEIRGFPHRPSSPFRYNPVQ